MTESIFEERLGLLELQVEMLRVLVEKHSSRFRSDRALLAALDADAEVGAFVAETCERIDAVANRLNDVLREVNAYRNRLHQPVVTDRAARPALSAERIRSFR